VRTSKCISPATRAHGGSGDRQTTMAAVAELNNASARYWFGVAAEPVAQRRGNRTRRARLPREGAARPGCASRAHYPPALSQPHASPDREMVRQAPPLLRRPSPCVLESDAFPE
jgi:hypothetical protein